MLQQAIDQLNAPEKQDRLNALREIADMAKKGAVPLPRPTGNDVNNHIHTTYSFSPYSPAKSVYMAWKAGLSTCGIIDHDTIAGAREFIEAGEIIGIATTIGMEIRVNMKGTPFSDRFINNQDSSGNAYCLLHGVPHTQIDKVTRLSEGIRASRGARNRKMVENINRVLGSHGITIDYNRDVLPLSMARDGGSVTERHLFFALGSKMLEKYQAGPELVNFLKSLPGFYLPDNVVKLLSQSEQENPYYRYDLLGAFKTGFVEVVYVSPDDVECIGIRDFVQMANDVCGIPCSSYLGDQGGSSVTGDKRAQAYEDSYMDDLYPFYKSIGMRGACYMPSRNTLEQLTRLQTLCRRLGLMEISGEDINQPRQDFIVKKAREPQFAHLVDSTWALIGHEYAATKDLSDALFSKKAIARYPDLDARIQHYKQIGLDAFGIK